MPRFSVRNRKRGIVRLTGSPRFVPWSAHKTPFIAAAIALGVSLLLWLSSQTISSSLRWRWLPTHVEEWEDRRQQVKYAFVSSWDAYSIYAWGWLAPSFPVALSNHAHQATTNSTPSRKGAR
jgi:mannosyl-oligosaccharide alpha-1,2-mannosidase